MINTYNNSLPSPPPVPPRGNRPEPRPGTGHSKWQIRGLTSLIFLHFLVTLGMFIYFWSNNRAGDMREEAVAMKMLQDCGKDSLGHQSVLDCLKISQTEGEGEVHSRDGQFSALRVMAHMKAEKPSQDSSPRSALKELQWDQKESIVRDVVHLYGRGMLQIGLSGYYYIYSQVTFSKTHPKTPLVQTVMHWSGTSGKEEGNLLMKAFCYKSSVEQCTSFQGGVFKLESGQKVSVNVTDKDLVHFDGTATTFGLFQLLQMP
ncbi:CD40 ligand-like [Paramormyrops kingsleyae]|uniref:CD40 ligand-like n=1 Tax=Paramormyrops kingsleyae TaxID=1676925 RepID=UPI003B96A214